MAVTSDGSMYVVGPTDGALSDQPGQDSDIFVRKYDCSGNEQWTRQFGTPRTDYVMTAAADNEGNLYVPAYTLRPPDKGPSDFLIRKYDRSGNVIWSHEFGSENAGYELIETSAVDPQGELVIAGRDQNQDPLEDAFVAKYDGAGRERWTRHFGAFGFDDIRHVHATQRGNILLTGDAQGALPGQTSAGDFDAFVRKYDPSGRELWTRQFGSSGTDMGQVVTTDADENVFVLWRTSQSESESGADRFLQKFDAEGKQLWSREIGARELGVSATTLDTHGNVYLGGEPQRKKVTDPLLDAYIVKYDPSGRELDRVTLGPAGTGYPKQIFAGLSGVVYGTGSVHVRDWETGNDDVIAFRWMQK